MIHSLKLIRRLIVECLMQPLPVIKYFDVIKDVTPSFILIFIISPVRQFILHVSKKTFCYCIIPTITFPTHAGYEFSILIENAENREQLSVVSSKIIDTFKEPFQLSSREITTSLSIDISVFPQEGRTIEDLLHHADTAMYKAKSAGRNQYVFYTDELLQDSQAQVFWTYANFEFKLFVRI